MSPKMQNLILDIMPNVCQYPRMLSAMEVAMSNWPKPNLSIIAVIVPFVVLLLVLLAMQSQRAI
jgi:hypothetical protein